MPRLTSAIDRQRKNAHVHHHQGRPTKNRRRPARGGSGPETTDEHNAEQGLPASEKLTDALQAVLVDLIELSIQGKQAH